MYSILLDFDGTLIRSDGTIENNDVNLFKRIIEENNVCVVSSSSFNSLQKFKNKYKLNIDIVSTSSGVALINNKTITNLIPKIIINTLINEFNDYIYTAFGEYNEKAFIFKYHDRIKLLYPKKESYISNQLEFDVASITFVIKKTKAGQFINKIETLELNYRIISSDRYRDVISIFRDSVSKSDAYYLLKDEYVNQKIIGVSDSYYDIDMISKCDIKVAMQNADSKLKEIADYVTVYDNDNGGAIKLLYDICHLK
ncbi:MAG: HAD hydrolase family protein [Acholeplasmatales bacterium]|nr:HAD hydrolase family protein [Acholeplasmatales bacterium]